MFLYGFHCTGHFDNYVCFLCSHLYDEICVHVWLNKTRIEFWSNLMGTFSFVSVVLSLYVTNWLAFFSDVVSKLAIISYWLFEFLCVCVCACVVNVNGIKTFINESIYLFIFMILLLLLLMVYSFLYCSSQQYIVYANEMNFIALQTFRMHLT